MIPNPYLSEGVEQRGLCAVAWRHNDFPRVVREAMGNLEMHTGERPGVLYIGRAERDAMREHIDRRATVSLPSDDPKRNETWFMGMRVFAVNEPTHLAVYPVPPA